MAEGWGRRLAPPGVVVHSAGSEPDQLNPYALRAMREVGIDISAQTSAIPSSRVATVVTLCAEEICPVFPGEVERLHWPLDDPAAVEGSEEQILFIFRGVRDAIAEKIRELFAR